MCIFIAIFTNNTKSYTFSSWYILQYIEFQYVQKQNMDFITL